MAIWIGGILIAASVLFLSIMTAHILTVIGLAFKDIFENFLAGILILFRETFRIEDYIECTNLTGKVEKITIKDTHIRQTDRERVVMPNAMLFKNPFIVMTDLDMRRVTLICGVGYDTYIIKVRELFLATLMNTESVLKDPKPQVLALKFTDSSIEFEIRWWTQSTPKEICRSRDLVVTAIKKILVFALQLLFCKILEFILNLAYV